MEYPGGVSLNELPELALHEWFRFGLHKSDQLQKTLKCFQCVCIEVILCTEATVSEIERKAAGQVRVFIRCHDLICYQLVALFSE